MNVFYKESDSKKIVYLFLFFFFWSRRWGGGGGGGKARVSECLTMDPNKKNVFGGEGEGVGGVAGGGGGLE